MSALAIDAVPRSAGGRPVRGVPTTAVPTTAVPTAAGAVPAVPASRPQPSVPSASAGAPRTRLRLTRRGRAVLTTLAAIPLVVVALVVGLASGGALAEPEGSGAPARFSLVIVEPGQTLWQIATDYAPHVDPRDVIADIVRLNALDSTQIEPGQVIALPDRH